MQKVSRNDTKFLKKRLTSIQNGYIIVFKVIRNGYFTPSTTFHTFNLWRGIFQRKENDMSKLKGYRVMLGLTQQAMAVKLDISLQSYNNKETGKTPFNDKEKKAIKTIVAEVKPDITIDELFYS